MLICIVHFKSSINIYTLRAQYCPSNIHVLFIISFKIHRCKQKHHIKTDDFFFHTKNSCNLISPHECTRLVLIPNRFQVYSYLLWFLIFNHELVLIWWCTSCTTILYFVIERFSSIRYIMNSEHSHLILYLFICIPSALVLIII